jgi:hypothetical protein
LDGEGAVGTAEGVSDGCGVITGGMGPPYAGQALTKEAPAMIETPISVCLAMPPTERQTLTGASQNGHWASEAMTCRLQAEQQPMGMFGYLLMRELLG